MYIKFSWQKKGRSIIRKLDTTVNALPGRMSTADTGIHEITAEGGVPGGPGSVDMFGVPSGSSGSEDADLINEINTADVEGGNDRSVMFAKISSVSTVKSECSDFAVLQMAGQTPMGPMPKVSTVLLNKLTSGNGEEESSEDEEQDVDNIAVDQVAVTKQVEDIINPRFSVNELAAKSSDDMIVYGNEDAPGDDIENQYTIE